MSTVSTTVNVSGMTCGHCVSSVSEELESLAGVEKRRRRPQRRRHLHRHHHLRPGALSPSEIGEAVAEAGYLVVANEA